jgi:hypothetical protein
MVKRKKYKRTNNIPTKTQGEPQAQEYQIKRVIYTPYSGAAGMLLHINGKLKSSPLS